MTNPSDKPSIAPPQDQFPLIRFKGICTGYEKEMVKFGEQEPRPRYKFSFTNVEVIESTEPYPQDYAVISIPYNPTRKNTAWSTFSASLRLLLPVQDVDLILNKNQEWWYGPAKMTVRREDGTFAVDDALAWQVVSIEGLSSNPGELDEKLLTMMDGKSDAEFYSAVLNSPELKGMAGYQSVVEEVLNRTLIKRLVKQDSGE